jgi:hypothetical protein
MRLNRLFYYLKPFIPRALQIAVRRQIALRKRRLYNHIWPIDPDAVKLPEGWSGWPDKKRFALVLTHDVDTKIGQEKCMDLIKIEKRMGFRSSFNFVPERYNVSSDLRHYLVENGFEVAVHGLSHDGKLFWSKEIFNERAVRINYYMKEWKSVGFHSPSMHRNLNWIHNLNIEYDQSTFDTDPFEPQPEGVSTIFPFFVHGNPSQKGYVELPYTLPQDHSLFIILKEKNIKIWMEKLDWIAAKGGMVLLNTHPYYMDFDNRTGNLEEYPVKYYTDFLEYIKSKYQGQYWQTLPKDIANFWVQNVVAK